MKKIITAIELFLLIFINYFVFSFSTWQFYPGNWEWIVRVFMVVSSGCCIGYWLEKKS